MATRVQQASPLYPSVEPYRRGFLRVGGGHRIYYEETGNRNGKPAVFLHGDPGGATQPKMRRFFDPRKYRIVLFDQRGCGRSRPLGRLVDNTTWHLISDIEALRTHLRIQRWLVFGGSWGSTLALAYAEKHPERVSELVLRGIFLGRRSEIAWLYQSAAGMAAIYPDQSLASGASYARVLARIECHYFFHRCFFRRDGQLLNELYRIQEIPAVIVHGRYDVICPLRSAWDLHRAWPKADLRIVADAGHSAFESGTARELVRATNRFSSR